MSAIYILTDIEGLNGQIKDELRDSAKGLVKDILSLTQNSNNLTFGSLAETRILFIHSLIDTARILGIFDSEVAGIFHQEYSELHTVLVNLNKTPSSDGRVSDIFTSLKADLKNEDDEYKKFTQIESVLDTSQLSNAKTSKDLNSLTKTIYQTGNYRAPQLRTITDNEVSALRKSPISQKDIAREELALKVIKDSNGASIKDISIHMPDISEKTVQRMLVSLLERGSIRKEGERRWSRYYFV